uniref:Uncharacterized protein n=1 Tax=Anguilla anguilla TaxID=7936 RepID=A0A0E9WGD3_ANGAN
MLENRFIHHYCTFFIKSSNICIDFTQHVLYVGLPLKFIELGCTRHGSWWPNIRSPWPSKRV